MVYLDCAELFERLLITYSRKLILVVEEVNITKLKNLSEVILRRRAMFTGSI